MEKKSSGKKRLDTHYCENQGHYTGCSNKKKGYEMFNNSKYLTHMSSGTSQRANLRCNHNQYRKVISAKIVEYDYIDVFVKVSSVRLYRCFCRELEMITRKIEEFMQRCHTIGVLVSPGF